MANRPARLNLRVTVTMSILAITMATAASLLALDHLAARASLTSFTAVLLNPLATLVGEQTRAFLQTVERSAQLAGDEVEAAGPSVDHFDEIEDRWYSVLATDPDLYYLQYGDSDGNFQLLTRQADGSLATQRILHQGGADPEAVWRERRPGARTVQATRRVTDAYDPRQRPWFEGAMGRSGLFWTDVYIHAAEHRPVMTAARRVSAGGRVVGVASATIALDRLSTFIGDLRLAGSGRAFIVDANGQLIAGGTGGTGGAGGGAALAGNRAATRLPTVAEAGPPELQALAGMPGWRRALAGASSTVAFRVGDQGYLAVAEPLRLPSATPLVVAAIVPDEAFLAGIKRDLARNILFSCAITACFVGLGLLLARALTSSLLRVVAETKEIQRLQFTGALPQSRFVEVDLVFRTYDRLKLALRAFERYVPMRLVRMLLEGEAEPRLGGRIETMTMLFSDIRGFTSLSEGVRPEVLAELLGEYLQCVSDVIAAHGGTVDKFVGDGVMAFWNAPRADAQHALHGTLAAIECRAAIERLPNASFFTRFGVHTQEVMVGNFGARDRFAYTLLGDGVNLASRLEGANKEYRTQILISEATASGVRDQILCRPIDRVAVKGKTISTLVFEAICPRGQAAPRDLELARSYEAALDRYFAGDFGPALALFGALAEQRPDDGPTAVMLDRCRSLAKAPPVTPWNPVHELAHK
jgi:adenylate cyclase